MDLLYKKVSELTKDRRKRQNVRMRDKEGIVLREPEHVLTRWKEYVKELYDEENKPLEEEIPFEEFVEEDMQGPIILFSEFETALVELKAKKAEGPDGIPGELLKLLGPTGK